MSNPEFVREYEFKDGLCIRCRSNCCLFCSYCTDIYYDWHGPYEIICEKKISDGFVTGMSGKCKSFCDRNNNEKKVFLLHKGEGCNEMTEKDFKQIENNLKDALEYERNLNKQILGRLDAYENIMKMMLTLLIEKASKDR